MRSAHIVSFMGIMALVATDAWANVASRNSTSPCLSKQATCCAVLSQIELLSGKVIFPNNTLYEARLASYYSANAALPPWCMVMPESTEDVSEFAQVVSNYHCAFGIRSGGHAAFTGSSSVDDGITIDFGYLNSTSYDAETKLVSIQSGARWGNVYIDLDPFNITVAGGRTDAIGVGGFTTGGGYSFHSGRTGFACDNVQNFEVVLANGSIVNANAELNSDLFQALKGSSGNLGIVTRFDMYAIEGTQIWGGSLTYNWTDRAALFNAYTGLAQTFATYPASQAITTFYYGEGELQLFAILSDSEANSMSPAFDNYRAITNTSDPTHTGSMALMVPEFAGYTPVGVYSNWFSGSVSNEFVPQFLEFYYTKLREYIPQFEAAVTHGSKLTMVGNMQPVPRAFVDRGLEKGGNIMGLEDLVPDDDYPLAAWLYSVTVTEAQDQPAILELAIEFVAILEDYATEIGANKNWHYLNYAYATQDPIAAFGETGISKIKAAANKYDPDGVFQKLRHSGFKIPA